MRKLLILAVALMPFLLHAQAGVGASTLNPASNDFFYDKAGRQIFIKSNYEFFGTPYFGDNYCTASVEVKGGKRYEGIKVKVNLQDNSVLYIDEDGKELVATVPISRLQFYDCTDASKNKTLITGMPAVDKQNGSNFYVVLDSGPASLLKYSDITFYDKQNNYGAATMMRYFNQSNHYYIYNAATGITKVGKENDEVVNLLGNHKAELNTYIAKNNIKVRKEEDLVKLVKYYNTLVYSRKI